MKKFFSAELKKSPQYNIAMTAAAEHLTALMAETFYGEKKVLQDAHPYVRALLAWHAIEEMEHRDVAFDVMRTVGEVPELTRKYALAFTTFGMITFTAYRANVMLKHDGFTPLQRAKMFRQGLPWLFGKKGVLRKMSSQYADWFKKDFHPSQHPIIAQYPVWIDTLEKTGDPIAAGDAFWQAAK